MLNNVGEVAHPSPNPLWGSHASLIDTLPFTLYSVLSCRFYKVFSITSFTPGFLSTCHRIFLFTLGYALVMSIKTAKGWSLSVFCLPDTTPITLRTSSFTCDASAVDLPALKPHCVSSMYFMSHSSCHDPC